MLYLNQLEYAQMPYEHNLKNGGAGPEHSNIKSAGCGLCCICMMIDRLTTESLSLVDCRDLSVACKANMSGGTDLNVLGPEIAKKFDLVFSVTNDLEEAMQCLTHGGSVIANSGGDREGHVGVFTHGGHYILVVDIDGDTVTILDPSFRDDKYTVETAKDKVTVKKPFLYCDKSVLAEDCENRNPRYYMFRRA